MVLGILSFILASLEALLLPLLLWIPLSLARLLLFTLPSLEPLSLQELQYLLPCTRKGLQSESDRKRKQELLQDYLLTS